MRKSILLFVLFTLTSIPLLLFAQGGYQVTGRIVSSEDNQPMIGVSVLEKGTTNGVITDINGNYSIIVTQSPATLQFSYIGMKTVDKQVTVSTRINLTMENDAQLVDEVVVVAYGVRKKGTIAGSVSTVRAEKLENVPAASFDQALQGQASGSNAAIVLMVAVMVMQYLSFRGHASAGDVIVDGILTWDGGIYLLIFAFFALIIVNLLLKAWVDKRGGSAE